MRIRVLAAIGCLLFVLLVSGASIVFSKATVRWTFINSLYDHVELQWGPTNDDVKWLRNSVRSTGATVPIGGWKPQFRDTPAGQDISLATLDLIIRQFTGATIELVHIRDGFISTRAIGAKWYPAPESDGWIRRTIDITAGLKQFGLDMYNEDPSLSEWDGVKIPNKPGGPGPGPHEGGHYLVVRINGTVHVAEAEVYIWER